MIQVKNLLKRYSNLNAVDDISFNVKRGEIVGLLGPNGAGKTTTMRMLTCFMPATAGDIKVGGFDVFKQSMEVRKLIGYMPENSPLYPEMRVIEYLRFRGKLKGLRGQNLINRINLVIDSCQLGEVYKRIIEQLSKGNKQRVALAEALIADPDLLILDEPTIGLDPNQVRNVRELIREVGRERTVVLSTHILSEVEALCERVIIMYRGKIAAEDSMLNLRGDNTKKYFCEVKIDAKTLHDTIAKSGFASDVEVVQSKEWAHATVSSKNDGHDIRQELFNMACDKAWPMRQLDVKIPSLEDIFVKITTK